MEKERKGHKLAGLYYFSLQLRRPVCLSFQVISDDDLPSKRRSERKPTAYVKAKDIELGETQKNASDKADQNEEAADGQSNSNTPINKDKLKLFLENG